MFQILLSNPFKTQEFKQLFQKWDQILKEDGLDQVEDFSLPNPALKVWHNLKWKNTPRAKIKETQDYYSKAVSLLHTYDFQSIKERVVWQLHCEGLSIREIVLELNIKGFRRKVVNQIILKIELKSGLKSG